MPVITFIKDIFSAVKGRYHRNVGRHTQHFCTKAVKIACNQIQKKLFFVAAICADEFIAALIKVDNKRQLEAFHSRNLKNKLTKQQVTIALRAYLSGMLVLISPHKEGLLAQTGFEEQELLHAWCSIFEYQPSDMHLFDKVLLPAYRHEGISGLSAAVAQAIFTQAMTDCQAMTPAEAGVLQAILLDDAAAAIRVLQPGAEQVS